ncbi:MAG: hypothetical protein OEM24_04240 [Paracoccaceae bacterium]|nr:hypothetical protein [Paracoccaceae bacterium]
MQFQRLNAFAACGLVVLAACAQPEPVAPEPVYDKYGNEVAECRPADQPVSTNYPSYLPICVPECPPGEQSASTAAGAPLVCVPLHQDGNDRPPQTGQGTAGIP